MPRNGSGSYSLPAGNPVSSGTLIEASWANTTLSDIASAVTDSLARSGEGGMTGPLRAADGTVSTPSVSFVSETATGFYRAGATDVRFAMAGVDVATLTTAGVTVGSTKVLALPDGTAAAPALTNTGDTNTGVFFPDADTVGVSTGGTERLRVDASGSGHLLVGTTTNIGVGAKVAITSSGNGIHTDTPNNSAALAFYVGGTQVGSIFVTTSATTYNTTSDYRLKTFVAKVTGSGQRIDALNPVEFEWKENGNRARGFFAHEFQQVYASSVSGEKDAVDAEGKPVYQAMQASTSEVIADLVAELQSLRARVAQLEAQS